MNIHTQTFQPSESLDDYSTRVSFISRRRGPIMNSIWPLIDWRGNMLSKSYPYSRCCSNCLLQPGNSRSVNAERKLVQRQKERLAAYEITKSKGDNNNDKDAPSEASPSIISFLPYFSFSGTISFLASGPILLNLGEGPNFFVSVDNIIHTEENSVSPTEKEKGIVAHNVGSRYQPTPTVEAFFDCLPFNERLSKHCYSENSNRKQVPQSQSEREKIAGRDVQRCLLFLKEELKFESSKSTLQQLLPYDLQPILRQLMPLTMLQQPREVIAQ
jgi:hypothetical protein